MGDTCTCGAMGNMKGMTRELHWKGSYRGQVERALRGWAKTWNVVLEELDERDGRCGKRPDVVLEWNSSEEQRLAAEIKEIVVPFCSFRSEDREMTLAMWRTNATTTLKDDYSEARGQTRSEEDRSGGKAVTRSGRRGISHTAVGRILDSCTGSVSGLRNRVGNEMGRTSDQNCKRWSEI